MKLLSPATALNMATESNYTTVVKNVEYANDHGFEIADFMIQDELMYVGYYGHKSDISRNEHIPAHMDKYNFERSDFYTKQHVMKSSESYRHLKDGV